MYNKSEINLSKNIKNHMKTVSTMPSKLSNKVLDEIKNVKNSFDLQKDVVRRGIQMQRRVIENGEEKTIKEDVFYELSNFKDKIEKEHNLRIKSKDIVNNLSILGHQGVFADAFVLMNSDDFKENIVMRYLYKSINYIPDNINQIAIGSKSFDILFIIDETNLESGKKVYLEMSSSIVDQIGKNEIGEKKATLGNVIYIFDLEKQTFQSKISSDNDNLSQEQLSKILKFANNNNYLFPYICESQLILANYFYINCPILQIFDILIIV